MLNDTCAENPFSNAIFYLGTILMFILAACLLTLQAIFQKILWIPGVIHANVQFLLRQYGGTAIVLSLQCCATVCYHVLLSQLHWPLPMVLWRCTLFIAPLMLGSIMENFVILVLAAERFIASWKRQFGDPEKSGKVVKIVMVSLWIFTLCVALFPVMRNFGEDQQLCYCYTYFANGESKYMGFGMAMLAECLIAIFCLKIHRWSKTRLDWTDHRKENTLNNRFQSNNNMMVSEMLLSVVLVRGISRLVTMVTKHWLLDEGHMGLSIQVIMGHYCVQMINVSAVSLICIFKCKPIKKRFKTALKALVACKCSLQNQVAPMIEVHQVSGGVEANIVDFQVDPAESQKILDNIWKQMNDKSAGSSSNRRGLEMPAAYSRRQRKAAAKYIVSEDTSVITNLPRIE